MAEAREELLLEINVSDSVTKLAELRKSIDELIAQREQLSEASKTGDIEATKALEKLNSTVRNSQTEYKQQQRVLDGYSKAVKENTDKTNFQNNSISANRALLKQLTAQYIDLKNPSEASTKAIRNLTEKLKEQEAAIGNTNRNVGNYGKGFSEVTGKLVSLFPALQGVALAQEGFNAALSANPIGAFVVGIQVLFGVLSSFKPVVEAVEKATAGLSAGFSALINGGNMVEAANEAARLKQELNDLEDAQNGVTIANAEFDAKINLLLKQLRNKSLTEKEAEKISAEIAKLADARFEKNREQQEAELKNAEDAFKFRNNLSQEELDALVERGKTKDILTEDELQRLKRVAKDAGISEKEIVDNAISTQKFVAEAAERKIKGDQKAAEEEIKSIASQRAAIIGLADARDQVQQTVDNRNAALADRFKAQRDKAENEAKAAEQKEISRLEKINIANEKALSKIRENAILQLEIQKQTGKSSEEIDQLFAESKLRDFKDFAAEQIRLQNEINENSKRIQRENASDTKALELLSTNAALQLELQRKTGESQAEIDRQFEESGLASFKEFVDAKNKLWDELNKKQNAGLITFSQEQKAIYDAIVGFVTSSIATIGQVINESNQAQIEEEHNKNEAAKQGLQDQLDHKLISRKEFDAKSSALDKAAHEKEKELRIKAFNEDKAVKIVSAVINTALAVVNALATAPTIIAGVIMAALAAATGAIQIGIIAAQQPPKFALGGGIDIDGKPHSGGGTPIHVNGKYVAEAEQGEKLFILKKNASEQIGLLSAFNQYFGGRSWTNGSVSHAATGGMITDGGFSTRELTNRIDNSLNMQQMESILRRIPAPELSIVELNSKQDSRNRSIHVSEA